MARSKALNSTRARTRKYQLAVRDGAWCAYCGRLFADLKQATIDHIAPYSLYRTWRIESTVLACFDCNHAKDDRLPLSLALLLTASADAGRTTPGAHSRLDWALLARLAAAHESARLLPGSANPIPDRLRQQSRPDQPEHRARLTLVSAPTRTRPDTRPDPIREAA
jgi:hypothetical protein